ncbi:hypothetical protein MMC07_009327 [Pseudocyphellaria aurata]|nr:hypothetical protein [Pseudocyphellaria aurata]
MARVAECFIISRPAVQKLDDLLDPRFLRCRHDASMSLARCNVIMQQASSTICTVVKRILTPAVESRPFPDKVLDHLHLRLLYGGEIRQRPKPASKTTDIGSALCSQAHFISSPLSSAPLRIKCSIILVGGSFVAMGRFDKRPNPPILDPHCGSEAHFIRSPLSPTLYGQSTRSPSSAAPL